MMSGLCKEGRVKEVMELLEAMNLNHFQPDVVCYNFFNDRFSKSGECKGGGFQRHGEKLQM